MQKTILTALIIAILAPTLSFASIRCSGYLIDRGDTKYELMKHCGKPDEKGVIGSDTQKYDNGKSEAIREEWYYENLYHGDDVIFIITGTRVTDYKRLD